MIVVLLIINVKMIRIPSAGVGGLFVGIFSSFFAGWLCVRICAPANVLKIAWGWAAKSWDVSDCYAVSK